jgi:AraC-like DNA-binding protein
VTIRQSCSPVQCAVCLQSGSCTELASAEGNPYQTRHVSDPTSLASSLSLAAFRELSDGLPHVAAGAKDMDLRYLYANAAFADLAGQRSPQDVIGKRAVDLFEPGLAELYEEQDREVLASGKPLQEHLEVIGVTSEEGHWFVTSKVRVLADNHAVLGLFTMSIATPNIGMHADDHAQALAGGVKAVRQDLARTWRASDLAQTSSLPAAMLERTVRRCYGTTPTQLVLRIRVEAAMYLLSHSSQPISDIAVQCGFYDQSNFTKQFRSATGATPGTYRATYPLRSKEP